ncbi:MAG: hypothetical protein AAF357_06835 [Verrucomicrobiota bacterium]
MKAITVAGGGLAGLSLGIALRRRGVPVQVFEASKFPRHRVCGEFMSGVSDETLEVLGIQEALDDAESLVTTVWHDRRSRIFSAALPSPARGISRQRLDQRLANIFIQLGGVFHDGKRFPVVRMNDEGTIRAVGRAVEKDSDWLGLKAHWIDFDLEADLEMHLGEDGYIGLSRVEDGRVNAAGLFRRRREVKVKGGESLIAYCEACGLPELGSRMRNGSLDQESCVGVSSFGFGLKGQNESGGFRVGDQRAIIPPFTGNGMSMALQSAELALPRLLEYASGRVNWRESGEEYAVESEKFFGSRLRAARWVHPFIFSSFGQRVTAATARSRLLPFSLLYRAVR